ncbi:hypothetical protein JB92DRAFT_1627430 [Gautieria morchelliformis]|nr:hypothetical protein JB92DRAFT_1627430 [Gautieria morchelliformis]
MQSWLARRVLSSLLRNAPSILIIHILLITILAIHSFLACFSLFIFGIIPIYSDHCFSYPVPRHGSISRARRTLGELLTYVIFAYPGSFAFCCPFFACLVLWSLLYSRILAYSFFETGPRGYEWCAGAGSVIVGSWRRSLLYLVMGDWTLIVGCGLWIVGCGLWIVDFVSDPWMVVRC